MKPPKDNKLLYEVDDKQSAVKGSRKMTHTEQMRWVPPPDTLPFRQYITAKEPHCSNDLPPSLAHVYFL